MTAIDNIINSIKSAKQEHEIKKEDVAEVLNLLKQEIVNKTAKEQIKEVYETNPDTNAFTDAEKSKLEGLENFNDTAILNSLDTKVDKITGKGLSANDFTNDEKQKLAQLKSSKFIREFNSEIELNTITGEEGSFAYVKGKEGIDVKTYIWDSVNLKWVRQLGISDTETPQSVKAKYETNEDTNVFTDNEKQKLLNLENYDDSEIRSISSTNSNNITQLKDNVNSIRQQITNESHFRGYFLTKAELDTLNNATLNDFAYLAEAISPSTTSNKWIYSNTGTEEAPLYNWIDSGIPVPDQMVPKTTSLPLMNGEAAIGIENAYAAGDHKHPVDESRASKEDFDNFAAATSSALGDKVDKIISEVDRVYVSAQGGAQTSMPLSVGIMPNQNSIVVRDHDGSLITDLVPGKNNSAASKWYVDNAMGNIDLSGKLDKMTNVTSTDHAYVKNADGSQSARVLTESRSNYTIVYRDANGRAKIDAPVDGYDIANKSYVDSMIPNTANFVSINTAQTISGVKTFSSNVKCNVGPTANTDLANKAYVDNKFNGYIKSAIYTYYITTNVNIWDYVYQTVSSLNESFVINVMCINRTAYTYNIAFPTSGSYITHIKEFDSISLSPNTCKEISCAYEQYEKIAYWSVGKEYNLA